MSRNLCYDDYEEYEDSGFEKLRSSGKKNKGKGHQSKHQKNDYEDFDDLMNNLMTTPLPPQPKPVYVEKKASPDASSIASATNSTSQCNTAHQEYVKKPFEFGPNTHELMGNKIDYDRVANIETIESEYKGKHTFGIKFTFKGKNANTRVIWYNQRQRERDMVFAQEYKFWLSIRTTN